MVDLPFVGRGWVSVEFGVGVLVLENVVDLVLVYVSVHDNGGVALVCLEDVDSLVSSKVLDGSVFVFGEVLFGWLGVGEGIGHFESYFVGGCLGEKTELGFDLLYYVGERDLLGSYGEVESERENFVFGLGKLVLAEVDYGVLGCFS